MEETYVLTKGACMMLMLRDYGIEPPTIKICEHMVEDLMEKMEKAGYVVKEESSE